MANITILGAGGFGIALAVMEDRFGHRAALWTPFPEEAGALSESRQHSHLLPGILLPDSVTVTCELDSLPEADLVLIATPSFAVRQTAARLAGKISREIPVVCVAKGLEEGSYKTLSQVIGEELPENPVVILSGPSHAEEVARGGATTVVAASRSRLAAEKVQDIVMNETFRIYVNDDVTGVELGGALKNVIALAAGVCDGLGLGDNAKAALMTRGIAEIARLGVVMGAKSETFSGLAGIGDLIVTCTSMHSRNRRAGILIGKGSAPEAAVREIGMTVEGYATAKSAWYLAQKHKVEMPIVAVAHEVLYQNKPAAEALTDLMGRPKRHESEAVWLLNR